MPWVEGSAEAQQENLFFMPDLSGPVAIQYLVVLDIDHWEVQYMSWRSPFITGGVVEAQAVGLV